MKPAPTLIDGLYRDTFGKSMHGISSMPALRQRLVEARRFVLDERMSRLLADLALNSFLAIEGSPLIVRRAEQMRVSARLPHRTTWIEYDLRASRERSEELMEAVRGYKTPDYDPMNIPTREGWLLETIAEQTFRATVFVFDELFVVETGGPSRMPLPFSYYWRTNDVPITTEPSFSDLIVGLRGYKTCMVSMADNADFLKKTTDATAETFASLAQEWSGTMRRIWALLATINDLPVMQRDVAVSKGFIARGSYRRFLDHRVITLHVPERRDLRRIARDAIALARRRAHQVRGHWRRDWRHPGGRIWIAEHQRGDASLGFVTHDYTVEHPAD